MRILLAAILAFAATGAAAQDPLMPHEVARSATEHYPEVLAAAAKRREAQARRLSSLGAFDARVESRVKSRLEGYYSGDIASVTATRPLGPLGSEVYGGYRIAQGGFPVYEDENFTNEGGEVKIGVLFSLLRDRAIDDRRAGVARADLGIAEAELDLLLTRIEVTQDALTAYWRWVAKARELEAYRNLLALAERRDEALRQEVASGARAEIFLTENAQNLTRRRELVRRAEQDLALAAGALSLYLRDEAGDPVTPGPGEVPGTLPLPTGLDRARIDDVLAARPDLRLLEIAKERLGLEKQLARNALRPRLDVTIEGANDLGAIGPGGVSRDPAELVAGVTLKVPLGNREAKGRLRSAEAALDALSHEQRLLGDQIAQELRNIAVNLDTARDLLALTRQESELAEAMRKAEVRRFEGGASNVFLVNLREQDAANARVRVAQAEFALAAASVAYRAAVLDEEGLLGGR